MVRAAEVQAQIKTFDSVHIFVAQIAANGKFESEYVGFAGSPSQQFQAMQSLKRVSTAEELFLLTHHRIPVVRLYALIALT